MIWQAAFKPLAAVALLCASSEAAALLPRQGDPQACPGYKASNVKTDGGAIVSADLNLAGAPCNVYGTDLDNLKLLVEYQSPERLHVKIYDADEQVYQIPESVLPRPGTDKGMSPSKSDLKFSMNHNPFSFAITRKSTGEVLFDTSHHPIVFESQYLGLRTRLPESPNLYGLGESVDPFRLKTSNYSRTLWSRDAYGTPEFTNLYGNHPVYFDYRGKNGTHGVFLANSNGMDVVLDDSDGQYLEYRTLGGVIDLYFLGGPSPKEVAMQYAQTVGLPAMMSYWHFGFHNCRYGYYDIYEVAEVVANYSAANIPLETQWADIDYMDLRRVFTLDPYRFPLDKTRELVAHLHKNNQHYVVMVDPAVAYVDYPPFNNGEKADAFMKYPNGSTYQGVVWPGVTTWPDWFAPGTQDYWNKEFATFFDPNTGVDIDALWIDMNEPSNFCDFPCTDPAAFAGTAGDPPSVRPLRLSPPRPIPGFSKDFQPTCVAEASFDCYAEAYYGESIFILGDVPSFGNGDPLMAAPLDATNYPDWQVTIQLPPKTKITYQYVRREADGTFIYEAQNRTLTTGDCHSGVQAVFGNITTTSGPHKRSLEATVYSSVQAIKNERRSSSTPGSMKGLPGRDLLNPPYQINNAAGALSNKTMQTDLIHANGLTEYDTHNLYGSMMSSASRDALIYRRPDSRPLVITRSTFAGAGAQVGHWLGDNMADWDHYLWTIEQLQEFAALFQVPMVGSDICGYGGYTNENLCSRWVWLGAFSPFFRDHQGWGTPGHELYYSPQVASASRAAIDIRYRLLDYAYTALWNQTRTGSPMLNPMFFMYPADINTATLPYQFFWGDAIMVAPISEENSTSVNVYFPEDRFYDFYTGAPVQGTGSTVRLSNIDYNTMPLYFKSGNIIPMRTESAYTTAELRQRDFTLVIAKDADGNASGSLYLDDGDSLVQKATSNIAFTYHGKTGRFKMTGDFGYHPGNVAIRSITVLGAAHAGKNGKYSSADKKAVYKVNIPLTKAYAGNFES